MSQETFIICDNLVKIYKVMGHEVCALQGLDMVVLPGELLGMVGVSGSGKSTLLNILGGLDRPNAGRVWVDGKDLLKMTDMALNRYRLTSVGFLWQQSARNLIPYLNALENVEYPMTIAGEFGEDKRQRAIKLLETVGLADRQHHSLSELSGGEQQRVAIAVALANNPRLLLADEPTGEVDGKTAQVIYQIFHDLQKVYGLTTLIVSHDPRLSHSVDRVISIRDGKISSETVRQNETALLASEESIADNIQPAAQHIELTVVDSAGRLQIPKDLREQYSIKERVRLEAMEGGVFIWPVQVEEKETVEDMVDRLEQGEKKRRLRSLLHWARAVGRRARHVIERFRHSKAIAGLWHFVRWVRGGREHDA
jgi:ABC-type lipoprotein export system ATPase subunit/bifunctional DNA-binding transcriptional regulator/antitoxin component of YhaV-PrlF toxin-antitoxin module